MVESQFIASNSRPAGMPLYVNSISRTTHNCALRNISDVLGKRLYHDTSAFEVCKRAVTNERVRVDGKDAARGRLVHGVALEV